MLRSSRDTRTSREGFLGEGRGTGHVHEATRYERGNHNDGKPRQIAQTALITIFVGEFALALGVLLTRKSDYELSSFEERCPPTTPPTNKRTLGAESASAPKASILFWFWCKADYTG